jgi:hypothetical protein
MTWRQGDFAELKRASLIRTHQRIRLPHGEYQGNKTKIDFGGNVLSGDSRSKTALEDLGAKPFVAVLGNSQFELAYPVINLRA